MFLKIRLLAASACWFLCRQYVVEVVSLIFHLSQNAAKFLEVNCGLFSVPSYGTPW